jgi:FkbM family methyltransferase
MGAGPRAPNLFFPAAAQLLVDANPAHEPALRAFCAARQHSQYAVIAAGRTAGSIFFDATHVLGGVAYDRHQPGMIEVSVTPLDTLVQERGLEGPFLLKLDTHGYEVPILDGAPNVLAACSVLCIEVYNFRVGTGSLRFYELCALLEGRGFRPLDIVQPMHRPLDGAFWQMDMLFARADSAVFATDGYV